MKLSIELKQYQIPTYTCGEVQPIDTIRYPAFVGYGNIDEQEDITIVVGKWPPNNAQEGKPFLVGVDFAACSACYEAYFSNYRLAVSFAKQFAREGLPEFNVRNLSAKGRRDEALYRRITTAMKPLVDSGVFNHIN